MGIKILLQTIYIAILICIDAWWISCIIADIKENGLDYVSLLSKLGIFINGLLLLAFTIWLWF